MSDETPTKIESKEIHNSHAFNCMMKAAGLIAEALTSVGLPEKQARIVLNSEAFEKIYDERMVNGHRPQWRIFGIGIHAVSGSIESMEEPNV